MRRLNLVVAFASLMATGLGTSADADGTGLFRVTHTAKAPAPSPIRHRGRWIDSMKIRHGDLGSGSCSRSRPTARIARICRKAAPAIASVMRFFVMKANGHPRQVTLTSESASTGNPFYDETSAWSPSGRRIAFGRGARTPRRVSTPSSRSG
jgi:hypothetical protein